MLVSRLTMNGDQGFSNSPSTTVKSLDSLGDLEGDLDEPDIDKTSFTARTKKVASHLKVSNIISICTDSRASLCGAHPFIQLSCSVERFCPDR